MRLGGPAHGEYESPDEWIAALQRSNYRAAYCPLQPGADESTRRVYVEAAQKADILIAEVGAWSNPLSPNGAERQSALELCKRSFELAEQVGARCCVNISGSRGTKWDGPDELNFTSETFEMIVDYVREIIDEVQPRRSFYALETMPWMYPDSPDSYLDLIKAIDRPQFAVHLDPVNMICSPQRYFSNADFIRECFAKLGPHIKSCHAKDIKLDSRLTVHLDETRPGLGALDYRVFLSELNKLDADTPIMLEHLPNDAEYSLAAQHVRAVADEIGVAL